MNGIGAVPRIVPDGHAAMGRERTNADVSYLDTDIYDGNNILDKIA